MVCHVHTEESINLMQIDQSRRRSKLRALPTKKSSPVIKVSIPPFFLPIVLAISRASSIVLIVKIEDCGLDNFQNSAYCAGKASKAGSGVLTKLSKKSKIHGLKVYRIRSYRVSYSHLVFLDLL